MLFSLLTSELCSKLLLSSIFTSFHCIQSLIWRFLGILFTWPAWRQKRKLQMGETLGQIKVVVVLGKRLVIRDFKSSDPYVVLKLGSQIAKTKVINSCLNPIWNEEFDFSFSEPIGILKLEVFDKDVFKSDDKMGHAELNLQPLVVAGRLRQILRVTTEGMTLRKVIPEDDNCIAADTCIIWSNGEVVQDVWLRLCDVESGEIELKIKLTKLPLVDSSK